MNRASVDIAGCDTHTGWTEDDDCPHCVIAAKDARIALMEKVVEAARKIRIPHASAEDARQFDVAIRAYDVKKGG